MRSLVKKLIPGPVLYGYHALVTWIAMAAYGFPARKLVVIGVTGTDGKTSTVNYISQILEAAGHKTGFTTTANFKIGPRYSLNPMKMTMPGRWHLARMMRSMLKNGARYAIIETTSEGLRMRRHTGISYDVAVFTNLTHEHIEAHGSFEKYRAAKEMMFASLSKSKKKPGVKKVIVANLDDSNAKYFLAHDADEKWGFGLEVSESALVQHVVRPVSFACKPQGISFTLGQTDQPVEISAKLVGVFNLKNLLAATAVALSQGVELKTIKAAIERIESVPGRMEPIDEGQPFTVIVDYAHAPASLELVYKTLREQLTGQQKLIAVLGAAGGGRDKGKRPILGGLAAKYVDQAIVTNEDPYDEDPMSIIDQVARGVREGGKTEGINFFRVRDRKEGMLRALKLAKPGDVVVITGKGCEPVIMSKGGERIAHDDRSVTRDLLHTLGFGKS
jgi:UDP-N-acetylmuramoyl-L-alanyl-D-glutamate--2,6-diaminopimelate ligase